MNIPVLKLDRTKTELDEVYDRLRRIPRPPAWVAIPFAFGSWPANEDGSMCFESDAQRSKFNGVQIFVGGKLVGTGTIRAIQRPKTLIWDVMVAPYFDFRPELFYIWVEPSEGEFSNAPLTLELPDPQRDLRRTAFDSVVRKSPVGAAHRVAISSFSASPWEKMVLSQKCDYSNQRISSLLTMKDVRRAIDGIHFDLMDMQKFRAISFVENGVGYVGISSDTVFVVYDMFYRMFSHPTVWPEIGHIKKESIRPCHNEPITRHFSEIRQGRRGSPIGPEYSAPKCPSRRYCADFLSIVALQFLLDHELAHIRFGHCEYVAKHGLPFISEFDFEGQQPALDNLSRQALEYEADLFAVEMTLRATVKWSTSIFRDRIWWPKTPRLRLYLWKFAVSSLFWLLGLDFDEHDMLATSHPYPAVRLMAIESAIDHVLKTCHPELEGDYDRMMPQLMKRTAFAFSAITSDPDLSTFNRLAERGRNGVLGSHVQKIWHRAKELAPHLASFSYCRPKVWPDD